jgi:hypothetical protein
MSHMAALKSVPKKECRFDSDHRNEIEMSEKMPLEKKPSTPAVPAAQFTQNFGRYKKFGRYKMEAQRQAVPASSHGMLVGYLVPPQEEEELRRLKGMRRSIDFAELTDEEFAAIDTAARMDPRHNHLDKMFGEEPK